MNKIMCYFHAKASPFANTLSLQLEEKETVLDYCNYCLVTHEEHAIKKQLPSFHWLRSQN